MHDTARETGKAFFDCYAREEFRRVLDVGSLDVNGTLRPFVPEFMEYCGCDITSGPNVDVVLSDSKVFPFSRGEFDLVISTSCFEHDSMFWLTFAEMARVVASGGFIYLSAPVGGAVHRHPIDAWRFYPDAGNALASWAKRVGEPVSLVESFIRSPGCEGWMDFIAIFTKGPPVLPTKRLLNVFPDATHIKE